MESNSVLNVVQELDNDSRHHGSFGFRDDALLKVLSAPPDEPLYINGTAAKKPLFNGDNSTSDDNLLIEYEASATSSIGVVDNCENENLPPPANQCANIEGYTQFFFPLSFISWNIFDLQLCRVDLVELSSHTQSYSSYFIRFISRLLILCVQQFV